MEGAGVVALNPTFLSWPNVGPTDENGVCGALLLAQDSSLPPARSLAQNGTWASHVSRAENVESAPDLDGWKAHVQHLDGCVSSAPTCQNEGSTVTWTDDYALSTQLSLSKQAEDASQKYAKAPLPVFTREVKNASEVLECRE